MDLGYFGKLPSRADFVRFNATAPVFRSFDEWIQDGLRLAGSPRFPEFSNAYESAGVTGFVFRPSGTHESLIGVIQPSRDQIGRKYPFFVAGVEMRVRPLEQYADIFYSSMRMVADAVAGIVSTDQLHDQIQSIQHVTEYDAASHDPTSFTLRELCENLWGGFYDVQKYAAFKNLIDLLLPIRGLGQPQFGYGLKFPLASGHLHAASLRFWLDACAALLAQPESEASIFWNTDNVDGLANSYLYMYYTKVPASGLFGIAQLNVDVESLYAIDSVRNRNPAELALSIPEYYGRIIESESASLDEVIYDFRRGASS